MSYLLDTNVLSELVRPKPDSNVLRWFDAISDEVLHISVLTLGEIRKGIELLVQHPRQEALRIWLENELPKRFGERVLPISIEIADRWGRLQGTTKKPLPAVDSLIAATALYHDLRLVTRNKKDFQYPDLQLVCPWDE